MCGAENQDHQLLIVHVIDDPIITDANAELPITATQLQTPLRSRVLRKRVNCPQYSLSDNAVKLAQRLERGVSVRDLVRHADASESELSHHFSMGNTRFLTRFSRCADVLHVFKSLYRSVEELGRDDHRAAPDTTRRNLDRLALRSGDVVALLATELRQGHGGHGIIVLLVQVVLKRSSDRPGAQRKAPAPLYSGTEGHLSCASTVG